MDIESFEVTIGLGNTISIYNWNSRKKFPLSLSELHLIKTGSRTLLRKTNSRLYLLLELLSYLQVSRKEVSEVVTEVQ